MTKILEIYTVLEYKTTQNAIIVIPRSLGLNSLIHRAILYSTILFSAIESYSLFLLPEERFFLW